jgi:hypothetical protein
MPIEFDLETMDKLVDKYYPGSVVVKNMRLALANYCKYYLLKGRKISDCNPPNADPYL